jgi:hypothetical protein
MGAAPNDEQTAEQHDAQAMFTYDIDIIAKSPFGTSAEGKEMAQLLNVLNHSGNVVYGETLDEGRGDWDGATIVVNQNFRGKFFPTVLELVHEGSHAVWRKHHPTKAKSGKDAPEDNVTEELHAQENQLLFYKYLKKAKGCPDDPELELRLERQARGTLRQFIEERFKKSKVENPNSR